MTIDPTQPHQDNKHVVKDVLIKQHIRKPNFCIPNSNVQGPVFNKMHFAILIDKVRSHIEIYEKIALKSFEGASEDEIYIHLIIELKLRKLKQALN